MQHIEKQVDYAVCSLYFMVISNNPWLMDKII
jgi:hypothetical protein